MVGDVNYGQLYLTHDPIAYFVPIMDQVNLIAMVRDPRDMIVSAAYYLAGLAQNDWKGVQAFWKTEVPEGADFQGALAILKRTGHNGRWFSTYLRVSMPHHVVRYEDLHQRPQEVVGNLLWGMGYGSPVGITEALEKASFERMSEGRQRGEEDPAHFFRKGIVGDWRNYFTDEESQEFRARFLEIFHAFGY
jgi:hypothetical protein